MAPFQLKRAPGQTLSTSSDGRLLIRETMRISAALASVPLATPSRASSGSSFSRAGESEPNLDSVEGEILNTAFRFLCYEEINGRRWKYVADKSCSGRSKISSIRSISLHTPQTPIDELVSFVRSYVVPEGFPNSVLPSYVPYMTWRAFKHFFGGAMGFFTTQTLLCSVGVSRNRTPASVAINWILKDGAGRIGKMLFSRRGRRFDHDLKQLRFSGDLLLELGAGLELATASIPQFFLPLACAANLLKNVAAVTSTSTRTPIYKAFAKGENIGDVTAKGECVGNIADLLGTGLSIMLSRRNPPLTVTFALLSCGYLFSSYQEVRSVVLPTLNQRRFSVAVDSFMRTGQVPSVELGNIMESVVSIPWVQDETRVVLGPGFKDAFQNAASYLSVEPLFKEEEYMVIFNPSKRKVFAVFKDKAKSDDILKAAFHAHVLLHNIRSCQSDNLPPLAVAIEACMIQSQEIVSASYQLFKKNVVQQGWVMSESHLNPGHPRLCY